MLALAVAAVAVATWSVAVPSLGRVLGLSVDVPASVEVVDHVVPGAIAAAAAAGVVVLLRRSASGLLLLFYAGVIALAGLWMTATHVPLLLQAGRGQVPWPAALWHSSGGPLLLAAGVALFLTAPDGGSE